MVYKVTGTATTSGKVGDRNVSAGNVDTGEITFNNSTSFDITADGTWTVEAVVSDKSGRPTVTRTTTNVRDTVAPTITSFTNLNAGITKVDTKVVNNDFGVSGQATGGGYTYYIGTTSKSVQTGSTYQYTGLTEKTAYTFKVIAKDKAGNTSEKTLGLTTKSIITDFAYTGSAQTYTVPQPGKYKLEVWGAQGGTGVGTGGKRWVCYGDNIS